MLPGRDGLTILRQLREKKNTRPGDPAYGPFGVKRKGRRLEIWCGRLSEQTILYRGTLCADPCRDQKGTGQQLSILQDGDVVVNLITREIKMNRGSSSLRAREFNLLALLMRSPGRVYTRTQILEHVWGYCY